MKGKIKGRKGVGRKKRENRRKLKKKQEGKIDEKYWETL